MKNIKEGKIEMLAILFERYHVKLYNFFWRMASDKNTSEDLVQEVFLRILKYRQTYTEGSKFTTWMYQVARNAHVDHLKKEKDESYYHERQVDIPDDRFEPINALVLQENIDLLGKALAMLPLRKREILVLSRFHDMKYSEIADLMQ